MCLTTSSSLLQFGFFDHMFLHVCTHKYFKLFSNITACFLEKLSATNVHTVACSTYPEPTTKCGTNPKTTRHDER